MPPFAAADLDAKRPVFGSKHFFNRLLIDDARGSSIAHFLKKISWGFSRARRCALWRAIPSRGQQTQRPRTVEEDAKADESRVSVLRFPASFLLPALFLLALLLGLAVLIGCGRGLAVIALVFLRVTLLGIAV